MVDVKETSMTSSIAETRTIEKRKGITVQTSARKHSIGAIMTATLGSIPWCCIVPASLSIIVKMKEVKRCRFETFNQQAPGYDPLFLQRPVA